MSGTAVVIKIAAMGDFLMATPAIRALAASGLRVTAVVGRQIEAVARRNPDLDSLIVSDDRVIFHGSFAGKLAEVVRLARQVRRLRPDCGFNFHRDSRYAAILRLAGVPVRIGFAARKNRWLNRPVDVSGIAHHVFQYARLAMAAGAVPASYRLGFPLTGEERQQGSNRLLASGLGGDGRWVALAPGGAANVKETMSSRRWPSGHFAELAARLGQRGLGVVVVGGPGDVPLGQQIAASGARVFDLCGRTSVAEAAAIFSAVGLVVSNDSGLMHLAAAVNRPVIALFGPTRPDEKKPLTERSVALWKAEKMPCAPCYHDGIFPDCREVACLEAITVDEVESAVWRALEGQGAVI